MLSKDPFPHKYHLTPFLNRCQLEGPFTIDDGTQIPVVELHDTFVALFSAFATFPGGIDILPLGHQIASVIELDRHPPAMRSRSPRPGSPHPGSSRLDAPPFGPSVAKPL